MEDHQESAHHHSSDSHSGHQGGHAHGHDHEGWFHQLRYLKHAPRLWTAPVNRALVEMIGIAPGEQALDVGAGMGPAVLAACEKIGEGRVFGVDPSPLMRSIMRFRRIRGRVGSRMVVSEGKAEDLPLEEGSIDAAWSINCVHHWGDDQKACREMGRVIKPEGRLVLLDEQFDDPSHPRHDSYDQSRKGQPGFFHEIDTDRLAHLLEEAGFEIVRSGDERVADVPVKLVWAVRRPDGGSSAR